MENALEKYRGNGIKLNVLNVQFLKGMSKGPGIVYEGAYKVFVLVDDSELRARYKQEEKDFIKQEKIRKELPPLTKEEMMHQLSEAKKRAGIK